MPKSRSRSKPPRRRELLDLRGGIFGRADRLAEAADGLGREGRVEAERERERQRVHGSVRKAEGAAERLCDRVPQGEPGEGQRFAGRGRAVQQPVPRLAVVRRTDHLGQPRCDQRRSLEGPLVGGRVVPGDIEGLGTVGERVQRRAHRLGPRQVEREAGVVDDPLDPGAAAPADDPAIRGAHTEARRPLGAGVGRRHRDERQPAGRRRRLRGVDRGAAADREDPVGARSHLDPVGRNLRPNPGKREPDEALPARARDEERPLDPECLEHTGQLVERPADDHARRPRANSTNDRLARVSARPAARTSWISRCRSSPSTRASASVPASSSVSIEVLEMNVTP